MSPAEREARYRAAERVLWDRLGVRPVERRIPLASGATVRAQEVGAGPPVVFIHGGSIAGTSWCTLVAALDGLRCILVDRPGCGLSDPVVGGPLRTLADVEAHADRLLADLLDGLGLERASVAATSYGGFFAFRGAAAAPDRVDRLVEYSWLVGAPSESAALSARLAALPGMKRLMGRVPMTRGMVRTALRQFGLRGAIDSGAFDDDMLDWAHALMRDTDTMANDIASSPDLVTPVRGPNRRLLLTDDLLAELTMPVLFVWGAGDPNGGAAVARQFAARLPDAELVLVPDGEHAPWLDDPDRCIDATRRFLLDSPADGRDAASDDSA